MYSPSAPVAPVVSNSTKDTIASACTNQLRGDNQLERQRQTDLRSEHERKAAVHLNTAVVASESGWHSTRSQAGMAAGPYQAAECDGPSVACS